MTFAPPMSRPPAAALLPTLVLLLALATAAPAEARSVVSDDASGDVQRFALVDREPRLPPTALPDMANADLTSYAVSYDERRVSVRLGLRAMHRTGPVLIAGIAFRYQRDGQIDYDEAFVVADRRHREGRDRLGLGIPGCRGQHRLDYARNRITLSFPSWCLGSPESLQFRALVFTTDSAEQPTYVAVDAGPGTLLHERWSASLRRD